MILRKLIFIITLFLSSLSINAQQLLKLNELVPEHNEHRHNYGHYFKESSNELSFIFASLFLGYKYIFSSQDGQHCTFSPSCSVYAIESIKKHGFIEGFADAVDRLTRCNGLSPEQYPVESDSHLLIDKP
jgi:uncharacterized protein